MDDGSPEPISRLSEEKWQAGIYKELLEVSSNVESVETKESPE